MNHTIAQIWVEKVTIDDIRQMFVNAYCNKKTHEWEEPCRMNRGLTQGYVFNYHSKRLEKYTDIRDMPKLEIRNMLWCFGEYLPNYRPKKTKKRVVRKPLHEEPALPIFLEAFI